MRIAFHADGVCTHVLVCAEGWENLFPGLTGVPSDTANVGDLWDGAGFTPPPPPPPAPADLLAYAADKRWRVETGGIMVADIPVATDDRSKLLVLGAARLAYASEAFTTPFKAADGSLHTLTAAQVIAISDAGSAHVQATFETFAAVAEQIEAGAITTFAAVDAAAWPPNG